MNCKICHANRELDASGRCQSCRAVYLASKSRMSYGAYMAARTEENPAREFILRAMENPLSEPLSLPKCRICGNNVYPPRRTVCSNKCEREANKRSLRGYGEYPERDCPICGKPFRADRRQRYCSQACAEQGREQTDRAWRESRKGTPPSRQCATCGAPLEGNGNKRYCSSACMYRAAAMRRKAQRKQKYEPRYCPICGKLLPDDSRRAYCSDDCYREQERRRTKSYYHKKGNAENDER